MLGYSFTMFQSEDGCLIIESPLVHRKDYFVSNPPKQLFCPLPACSQVFVNPVALQCGHSVCRICSQKIDKCPSCHVKLSNTAVVPNKVLESQIDELLIHCPFGVRWNYTSLKSEIDPTGCKEQIKLGDKDRHTARCPFRWTDCPKLGLSCGKIRFCDINQHRCKSKRLSTECLTNDTFIEDPIGSGSVTETANQNLSNELLRLRRSNRDLKATVEQLTDKVKSLEGNLMKSVDKIENMFRCLCQAYNINNNSENCVSGLNDLITQFQKQCSPFDSVSLRSSQNSINRVNAGCSRKMGHSWQMPFSFKCIGVLRGHTKMIRQICVLSPTRLVSSSDDMTIKIWDISFIIEGRVGQSVPHGCISTLSGHKEAVICLSVVDENTIISGDREAMIKLWNLKTLSLVREVEKTHIRELTSLAHNDFLVFTGSLGEVKMWRLDNFTQLSCISGLNHYVRSLLVTTLPDNQEGLLLAGAHGQIWSFTLPCNSLLQPSELAPRSSNSSDTMNIGGGASGFSLHSKIRHPYGSCHSLAVSKNTIIAGTYNKCMQLFDLITGNHIGQLAGHLGAVNSIDVEPSGNFLVSASGDGSVHVWDLKSSLMVQQMVRHAEIAQSVALLDELVFSGGDDAELKIYKYYSINNTR